MCTRQAESFIYWKRNVGLISRDFVSASMLTTDIRMSQALQLPWEEEAVLAVDDDDLKLAAS